jgi:hypothetical protein
MLENYRLLFDQIGAERFAAAVQRVIFESGLRYFPSISEFRSYVPELTQSAGAFCNECEGGWRYVPDHEARRLYKNETAMAVVRCQCRRGAAKTAGDRNSNW